MVWAFFCAPCVVVSLSTSLWEGFLMALVEMGLVMCGRKLSLCVTLGGHLSRSGSSVLTPNQCLSKLPRRGSGSWG